MRAEFHESAMRRRFLIALVGGLALAGCSGASAGNQGRVAFQRRFGGQAYAIDLARGFSMPVTADAAAVFKQTGPAEWYRVRDPAEADRMVADFNANRGQWRELPSYRRDMLWRPPTEPLF